MNKIFMNIYNTKKNIDKELIEIKTSLNILEKHIPSKDVEKYVSDMKILLDTVGIALYKLENATVNTYKNTKN
nr:MAG TPA: hypothetical protein [Caudoviricetes sp.]